MRFLSPADRRFRTVQYLLVAAACLLGLPLAAHSQTQVVISPTKDNTLYEDSTGSFSNGAGEYFFVGRIGTGGGGLIRRGVLAFDLAGNIPAGSNVTAVTLTLNMSRTSNAAQAVSLNRVLADWGEGTSDAGGNEGQGGTSTPGDATWIHTFYDTSTWSSPGGDFSATVSDSQSVNATGPYTWGSTAQMVNDVQQWLDIPASNFGWIVIGNESTELTSKRFDSGENAVATGRPKLTVTYTPPPAPAISVNKDTVTVIGVNNWHDSLVVRNSGSLPLVVDSIVQFSLDPIQYAVRIDTASFTLAPGDSQTVIVSIPGIPANATAFDFMDSLRIYSNARPDSVKTLVLRGDAPTAVTSESLVPTVFELRQNYPNPFNPVTVIRFSVARAAVVSLKIYDLLGQEVATLMNEKKDPGRYEVTWNGAGFASGVYFYRLHTPEDVDVKKLILLK